MSGQDEWLSPARVQKPAYSSHLPKKSPRSRPGRKARSVSEGGNIASLKILPREQFVVRPRHADRNDTGR